MQKFSTYLIKVAFQMNKEKKGKKKSWHKLNQSFGKLKQDLYFTLYQDELQCKKWKM